MMRTRLKTTGMRGIASWALCLLLSFAFCTVALAAQDATLTLQMSYSTGTAGSKSTPISGVTATAYRVAELDDAVNTYTLVDDFASLGIDFNNGLDAAGMEAAAKQAAGIVSASGMKGVSATSNAKGEASFGTLPYGVYLVVQTGSAGDAAKYENFTPFLISVPQITEDGVLYEVVANPKTAPKPPAPPEEPPTTGDTTNLQPMWGYAAVGGAMVLVGIRGLGRIRRKDADRD